jgi:prevent-host-death family protein
MKTVTTREAQHHLSLILNKVESGQEILLTRRGKPIAKLTPLKEEDPFQRRIDWADAIAARNSDLGHLPQQERNIVIEMREESRY